MPLLCQAVPYEKQKILYELECYVLLLETCSPQLIDKYTQKLLDIKKQIREWNRTY